MKGAPARLPKVSISVRSPLGIKATRIACNRSNALFVIALFSKEVSSVEGRTGEISFLYLNVGVGHLLDCGDVPNFSL